MAVAWSKDKVGHGTADVTVRDPVVLTATLPRFVLSGDRTAMQLDLDNVEGAAGDYRVSVTADGPVQLGATAPQTLRLGAHERNRLAVPLTASGTGIANLKVDIAGPGNFSLQRNYALAAKPANRTLTRRTVRTIAAGESLTLSGDMFADLVPGTGSVAVSVGPSTALDVATLLKALDRYPFGCSEQIASRALPLLYVNELAAESQLALDTGVDQRIRDAIDRLLARQGSNGAFGLWSVGGDDAWLDAYVTDFLTRARERGFAVPDTAFKLALDRLRNFVSNAAGTGEERRARPELRALCARPQRRRAGRRPALHRRHQARRHRNADRQGAARRRARSARRPGEGGAGLCRCARRARAAAAVRDRTRGLRLVAARCGCGRHAGGRRRGARGDHRHRGRSGRSRAGAGAVDTRRRRMRGWCSPPVRSQSRRGSRSTSAARDGRARSTAASALPNSPPRRSSSATPAMRRCARWYRSAGAPVVPEPATEKGFKLERLYFTLDGKPANPAKASQNQRFAVVLKITESVPQYGRIIVADYLPAGFEIDNPRLVSSGDTGTLDWIENAAEPVYSEFRDDHFAAAFDRTSKSPTVFTVAYVVRAVSPGTYVQPQAFVEDMYRPDRFGRTGTGTIEVSAAR